MLRVSINFESSQTKTKTKQKSKKKEQKCLRQREEGVFIAAAGCTVL